MSFLSYRRTATEFTGGAEGDSRCNEGFYAFSPASHDHRHRAHGVHLLQQGLHDPSTFLAHPAPRLPAQTRGTFILRPLFLKPPASCLSLRYPSFPSLVIFVLVVFPRPVRYVLVFVLLIPNEKSEEGEFL